MIDMDNFAPEKLDRMSVNELRSAIRDLCALAMVSDATLHVVIAFVGRDAIPTFAHGQINAAIESYQLITGDSSLVTPFTATEKPCSSSPTT